MQDIYRDFLTPNNIDVQSISPCRSKIVLEPLERGFGHTLGNAIRRTDTFPFPPLSGPAPAPAPRERRRRVRKGLREPPSSRMILLPFRLVRLHLTIGSDGR